MNSTHKRIELEKNYEKDGKALCKLMKNAIYGKTMENLRHRTDVKLVNSEKEYLKCSSKASYMSHKIFNNNLVTISKSKIALTIYKPTYIGVCILDLSKILMCEFHSDYIRNKYGNKSKVVFTDTDSLIYEIKAEDVYEDFNSNKEMFDFSKRSS